MLKVTNLTVQFGSVTALAGVSLAVQAGELLAVCGEPGAGKTALVRCVSGDLTPSAGTITIGGAPLGASLRATERQGISVVWQETQLCETLDVAGNLLLGRESAREVFSDRQLYARAAELIDDLQLPIRRPTQSVASLTPGERGLLALGMALANNPRLLVLDEPTSSLGVNEIVAMERLARRARSAGAAVLLTTRDVNQMFRIADRIAVLRRGHIIAHVVPSSSHPDDVNALMAGGNVDRSARRQLMRLHGLADSLAIAEPSSGLMLIVAALAAALNIDRSRIELVRSETTAAAGERVIVNGKTWLVPVAVAAGGGTMLAIHRNSNTPPSRDELDLLGLYAGYAAAALERQESEQAQRDALALRRSQELQRQFLSRLSHELRTPLTAIRGYASSLLAPDITWDGDSKDRFLQRISAESTRLGRLVDDLLDFSAIESGVMRMQLDWCELELVVQAAVECLPEAARQRVTLRMPDVPPVIWADHDRLEQVFVNLLTNATGHNPASTRVTVDVQPVAQRSVEVTVSDNGRGLPPELAEAPFDSGHRARTRTAGAGLGLSIARGIVQAHGGTIEVVPTTVGTTFRIRLPLEAPGAAPEPAPAASSEASSTAPDFPAMANDVTTAGSATGGRQVVTNG
ncbi:MAG: ATP-binding cassette domain-containing protein [Solirubrobacteraceae bacterium]